MTVIKMLVVMDEVLSDHYGREDRKEVIKPEVY